MSYCDLLERMMQKDTEAFLELTDRYGWALYSEIRKKYPNKEVADRIYDDTMQQFYSSLQNPACEDPVEALLCAFADRIGMSKDNSASFLNTGIRKDAQPPDIRLQQTEADIHVNVRKKKTSFWFKMAMMLGVAGFVVVVWVGVGLMMEAGMVPYYDFGYTWVTSIVAEWL